ncbi:MAG: prolyl oligopeptidase family serine peptidase [Planctomycetota bacterium JB042]
MSLCSARFAAPLLAVAAVAAAQDDAPDPIEGATIERLLRVPEITEVAVDPDGGRVAYVVRTPPAEGAGPDLASLDRDAIPYEFRGSRLRCLELESGEEIEVGATDENAVAPSWSPDGRAIAFVADGTGAPRLCVSLEGQVHAVGGALADPRGDPPRWASDDELWVHLSAEQVWNALPGLDDESASERDGDVRVLAAGREELRQTWSSWWSRDPIETDRRWCRVRLRPEGEVRPLGGWGRFAPSRIVASPSGRALAAASVWLDTDDVRVTVFDAASGEELRSVDGVSATVASSLHRGLDDAPDEIAWHPTADRLAYVLGDSLRALEPGEGGSWTSRLLAEGSFTPNLLAFTRDGASVVVGIEDDAFSSRPETGVSALSIVATDPGADDSPVRVDAPIGTRVTALVSIGGPTLWQPEGDRFRVLGLDDRTGETLVGEIETATGAFAWTERGRCVVGPTSAPRDHRFLVVALAGPGRPPDLHRWTDSLFDAERLTDLAPALRARPAPRVRSFTTSIVDAAGEARTVRTGVLLPPDLEPDARPPGLVHLYGGLDLSTEASTFGGGHVAGMPAAAFAAHGFAVLHVDAPLSPVGAAGEPLRDLVAVLESQLDRAHALGLVDGDRVAVVGASYGGYNAAGLLSVTHRYRAGVAVAGLFDLPAMFAWMGPYEFATNVKWAIEGQGRMGAAPWDDPERYRRNSPYHLADRIRSPLLLVHGAGDGRVPSSESEKLFNALEHLERTAQLALYPDQGHAVRWWSVPHAADATKRTIEFLERYVRTGAALRGRVHLHGTVAAPSPLTIEWASRGKERVPVDDDGGFDFGVVGPGDGRLIVRRGGANEPNDPLCDLELRLDDGEDRSVALHLAFTSVSGRVTWGDDGSPIARARVSLHAGPVRFRTETDETGTYRFPAVSVSWTDDGTSAPEVRYERYQLAVTTLHGSPRSPTHEAEVFSETITVFADVDVERRIVVGG